MHSIIWSRYSRVQVEDVLLAGNGGKAKPRYGDVTNAYQKAVTSITQQLSSLVQLVVHRVHDSYTPASRSNNKSEKVRKKACIAVTGTLCILPCRESEVCLAYVKDG